MDIKRKFIPEGLTKAISARDAFEYCREFTAFFLILLLILIPIIALVISYIIKIPAAYLLHDIFLVTGILIIIFAFIMLSFSAAGLGINGIIKYIKTHIYAVFFSLLLLWALVSALLAEDKMTAFFGVPFRYNGFLTLLIYGAVAVTVSSLRSEKRRNSLSYIFLFSSVILSLVMLSQNYGVEFITKLNGNRNQSVLLNPNHFGYLLAVSVLYLSGKLASQKRILPAVLWGLLLVFESWVMTINDTFGSELAVFAALLLLIPFYRMTVTYKKRLWPAAIPFVVFAAVYLLSGSLTAGRGGSDAASFLKDTKTIIDNAVSGAEAQKTALVNSDRFDLWLAAAGYATEKPVFGWGPDSLGPLFVADNFTNTAAHNEYIQAAAELGFPALLLYLAGLVSFFFIQLKALYRQKTPPSSAITLGAAFTYIISAFFGVSLFYTAIYLYLFLGLSSSYSSSELIE